MNTSFQNRSRLPVAIGFLICFGGQLATAGVIAQYTFENAGTVVPNSATGGASYGMTVQPNGTSFASADLFGSTAIAQRLGQSGRTAEPVEPTSQKNNYGFWVNKELLRPLTDWSVLLWVNRADADNADFLFYIGDGDGFGGTGAETFVYLQPNGSVRAMNYRSNSSVDMDIRGGNVVPRSWHQIGLVRQDAATSLFVDGSLVGQDSNSVWNSFNEASNSVIAFGAAKWMNFPTARTRVHDGLIDQIEVYDHALTATEINRRRQLVAVPEPSALLGFASIGLCSSLTRFRRKRLFSMTKRRTRKGYPPQKNP